MVKAKIRLMIVLFLILPVLFFVYLFVKSSGRQIPEMSADMVVAPRNMALGVLIDSASCNFESGQTSSVDVENSKKEIDAASLMNFGMIRIDLDYENTESQEELQRLDEVVSYARTKKMKIILAYYGRKSWFDDSMFTPPRAYGGSGRARWEDFKAEYMEKADFLSRRYKNEYFFILPECPYLIGNEVNTKRELDEWLGFAKEVSLSIKKNSLDTKIILEEIFVPGGSSQSEMEFAGDVIQNNDPAIDVISMKAQNADELEDGMRNLVGMKNKYHWQGDLWMSSVKSESDIFDPGSNKEDSQKNFLLYSIHLANTNGFGGLITANLRDGSKRDDGILKEDYSAKPSYDAIRQIMGNTN